MWQRGSPVYSHSLVARRSSLVTVRLLVVAPLFVVAASPPPPAERECVRAARWVRENRNRLPTRFTEFSRHSLAYRKAIYAVLTETQRRDLWRAHLSSFLGPAGALSRPQRAIVQTFIQRLDRYVAAPAQSRSALERDGYTAEFLRTQFSDTPGAAIFVTFGPSETRRRTDRPALALSSMHEGVFTLATWVAEKLGLRREARAASHLAQGGDCECSITSPYCGSRSCVPLPCQTGHWCGTLWCYLCDGLCSDG